MQIDIAGTWSSLLASKFFLAQGISSPVVQPNFNEGLQVLSEFWNALVTDAFASLACTFISFLSVPIVVSPRFGFTGCFLCHPLGRVPGVSTYNLAPRVTRFFAKVSRPLTAPPCASGGFGAGRLLPPPPPPPGLQKSEKSREGSAPVATGSRRRKRVTNGRAQRSKPRIDRTAEAPGIVWLDARKEPQGRRLATQCRALHVATIDKGARDKIGGP